MLLLLVLLVVAMAPAGSAAATPSFARDFLFQIPAVDVARSGLEVEVEAGSQLEAEEIFSVAEAAVYVPKLRKVRLWRPDGAASPALNVSGPGRASTLGAFVTRLAVDFPGLREGRYGQWIAKLPAEGRRVAPARAPSLAAEIPSPDAVVFSEGFESGMGNWDLASDTPGTSLNCGANPCFNFGATSCEKRTGTYSADSLRGGAAGLSCTADYPANVITQISHKSCESLSGASQAWLDYYIHVEMDGSASDTDFLGVFYADPADPNKIYGFQIYGSWGAWYHIVLNLKQWYRLGDLTQLACPQVLFQFYSDTTRSGTGFGARIDDVTIRNDAPSALRCAINATPVSGAKPLTVNFTANVQGTGSGDTYYWLFGDAAGSNSSNQTASFTYSASGTYYPRLRVVNGANTERCYAWAVIQVTDQPTCSLTCNASVPTTGTAGTAVSFTGSATPSNCSAAPSYSWNFGDNQTSTSQSPSHAYANAGTYNWTLRVTANGQECVKQGSIAIAAAPAAKPGDCDGNGTVSQSEVERVARMVLGTESIACGADINGNGRVTIDELQKVVVNFLGAAQGISVTVTPATVNLQAGGTQQFTATVSGTTNTAVSWSVQESGGGSVTSQGFYTAPQSQGTYHVVATSQADASKKGTATVTVGPVTAETGVVYGTVRDTNGAPIGDVRVTVGSRVGQTNSQGYYTVDQVPVSSQERVQFEKPGFVPTTKLTKVEKGQGIYIEANIGAFESTRDITGSSGGTVTTPDGGSATIEANSLVDGQGRAYTGTASVSITTFDPTKAAELNAFPGSFEGVTKSGQTIPFITYGFMDVTVTGGGSNLQLASGKTATLRIPVPEAIRSSAPATLPQWYFDPADGKWHEEGVFTLKGTYYEGTIPHFSIWNCDVGAARCTIRGRVVDTKGQPVRCARVTMENLGPRGRFTSGESCTPIDGTFAIPVDANSRVRYWAEKGGTKSDPQETDTCVNGGERNIGDIVLGTLPVKITLTWGKDPEDLDSHLAIPKASGSGWEHLYFDRAKQKVEDAMLDTDDVNSYGPEIMSVYVLHKGTYRYSVHHFYGSGTVSTSGANVSLIVEGRGIFEFKPPGGGTGLNDLWRVFDLVVDASGNVTINPINDIIRPTSENDFLPK